MRVASVLLFANLHQPVIIGAKYRLLLASGEAVEATQRAISDFQQ